MSRSPGSLHTMELSLQISLTPPALVCMLCGRGVMLKLSPFGGSMSDHAVGSSVVSVFLRSDFPHGYLFFVPAPCRACNSSEADLRGKAS